MLFGLSFMLAVGGITKVSYIGGGPVDRVAIRLIGATGLVGAGVAVLAADGFDGIIPGQAVVMPLAPVLAALAARRQWTSTGARPRRANTWLPYLAIAAVDLPLVLLPDRLTWSNRLAIGAAVLVTALVAVRQFVAIRENARLLREKRASEERLKHEVTHDGLTGLANRGLFRERLTAALAAGEATVLLVDLDDFKTVNDSLGHEIGDHLLIAVAGALRTAVGGRGLPVRLGGDEFAVLIDDVGVDGEAVAQRILDAFAGPMSAHHLLVHASIGIATADAGGALDHLLRDADVAMYAAKQRGKANWVRYHGGMEQPVFAHARLGGELRRALDADEFRVVYQPIMELGRGRVVGVEALVRWQHPTRGLVSPADFIPAAEGTGLIVPLGRFVLREACRQAAAWLAEFGPDVLQKIAPNVSVRQLHDPDFVADVRHALAETGLPADRLVLELTESARAARPAGVADPAPAARHGHPAGAGRLRHRRVVAEPAARVPRLDRQAGQVVRRRHRTRRGGHARGGGPAGGGPRGDPAGRRARPGHGRRGHREPGAGRPVARPRLHPRPGLPPGPADGAGGHDPAVRGPTRPGGRGLIHGAA